MRSASRVFAAIGAFGLIACVVFASAGRFHRTNVQGPVILGFFTVACLYLAYLLAKQAAVDVDGLTLPEAPGGHDEEIHLPGPSWYPAFYAVAGGVLVGGLVYHRLVLVVGVVLVVLTTIGWGVESVRDYRREVAHHKPAVLPAPAAIDLAHQVLAFRRAHGGADAVVQHLGRGRAEVVLVGADGAWGNLVTRDVAVARDAAALAGTTLHDAWPSGLGARVRTGPEQWQAMGGVGALSAPGGHDAPRDGATQTAARVFASLAVFAFLADFFYASASKFHRANAQAIAILTAFALANTYLAIGLRNAKAQAADAPYAGDDHVTVEPTEPAPPVDLATLHLPGPSWFPAFFSIALGLLVFGLVYSPGMLVAGIVLTVLCCVGWGVESVREYRQQIAGHH